MRYLTVEEVVDLHGELLASTGGIVGLRDPLGLSSAVAQPQAAFGGSDLYPTVAEKACALAYSLTKNHPFLDGNKRIGFGAMLLFLKLNNHRLEANVDDAEQIVLGVVAGSIERDALKHWIANHIKPTNV